MPMTRIIRCRIWSPPLASLALILPVLMISSVSCERVESESAVVESIDPAGEISVDDLDPVSVERFASLALDCVEREYPNKIGHVLQSDADVKPPRDLTPAFAGCFDWHSAVHGHWLLVRLARLYPDADFSAAARTALAHNLTPAKIAVEVEYFAGEDRGSFERPYGLAWLLQLAAELREWSATGTAGAADAVAAGSDATADGDTTADDATADDAQMRAQVRAQVRAWTAALAPLEREAAARFASWLPKLHYPIRTGEHSQTAFALGLALDWARTAGDGELEELIIQRVHFFHDDDRECNLAYEPSGQDFLSPCLAEADLMRRILPPRRFADWLGGFLPEVPRDGTTDWLPIAVVTDRRDGKLAHLDGLNISRAWMLEGIAGGLPAEDSRRASLIAAANQHRVDGLAAVTGEHYAGGHWLGSFATYLVTRRGIRP